MYGIYTHKINILDALQYEIFSVANRLTYNVCVIIHTTEQAYTEIYIYIYVTKKIQSNYKTKNQQNIKAATVIYFEFGVHMLTFRKSKRKK